VLSLESISYAEWGGFIFGIVYILVASKEYLHSWIYGLISAICTVVVDFTETRLYMDGLLHVLYAFLALFGILLWLQKKGKPKTIRISRISYRSYLGYILLAALISAAAGYLLDLQTDAQYPYVDSFTSILAVFATCLVIYRILDVWSYWVVINLGSLYLYWMTGAPLLAALYIAYLISNILKWRQWQLQFSAQSIRSN